MEGLSHTPFIAAAYAICFGVLGSVAFLTWRRARAAKRQADALDAQMPRRRKATSQ